MDRLLTWPCVLETLLGGDDLAIRQAEWAMAEVVAGRASEAQVAGFLIALRAKGVVAEELVGFRDAILEAAVPLPGDTRVVDIVGTGGDRLLAACPLVSGVLVRGEVSRVLGGVVLSP